MSVLKEIQQQIKPELDMLQERIKSSLTSSNTLMNSVVTGYLESKGKQIRPILVVLTAKLLGEVNDNVISAAAAVEMLHNATLIHDDVVDDSMLRRGRATINSLWDNRIAVLVGDFFVSNALRQAVSTGNLKIVDSVAQLGKILSVGELDQIYNARSHNLDERAYLEMISRKTASLFVACVRMGAYAVGVDDERLERLSRYAELLGLCFQIRDDIFDYFEDPKIGKPTGNDLREGKLTLPLLYALSHGTGERNEQMHKLINCDELSSDQIAELIEYAKQEGGIEYAYDMMSRFSREASELLDGFGDNPVAATFRALCDYVAVREA